MSKKKRLNGLPHNLVSSYFATDKYCVCGYMADWLYNAAKILGVQEMTIDIINQAHFPSEFNIHPFTYENRFLKGIVDRNLSRIGLEKDFIIEAKIKVVFRENSKELICFPQLVDKENNKYECAPITTRAFEGEFDPFI